MHKITVKPRKIRLIIISRKLTVIRSLKNEEEKVDRSTCGLSAQVMRRGTGPPPLEARPGHDLLPWEQALERDLLPREQDLEGEPPMGA
jgi:hypothetical protein